jgi:hypothetical protein
MNDLILLVADKNMEFTLRGALSRYSALGIRPISFRFLKHSRRDPGVRSDGPDLLALAHRQTTHALLVMDFEGSGTEAASAIELEMQLDERLQRTWGDSAKAIVIEPELETWLWGSDNALSGVVGRPEGMGIRDWLKTQGYSFTPSGKPERPKEAMESLTRKLKLERSSTNYEKIALKISLDRCTDPAFQRLRQTLQRWFPA